MTSDQKLRVAQQRPEASGQPLYRLEFIPQALEEFRALDGSVRSVLKKLLSKRLEMPHLPGAALSGELARCYKIKLVKQGVRLVYHVEDERLVVLVLAVDKRERSAVYKSATLRWRAAERRWCPENKLSAAAHRPHPQDWPHQVRPSPGLHAITSPS